MDRAIIDSPCGGGISDVVPTYQGPSYTDQASRASRETSGAPDPRFQSPSVDEVIWEKTPEWGLLVNRRDPSTRKSRCEDYHGSVVGNRVIVDTLYRRIMPNAVPANYEPSDTDQVSRASPGSSDASESRPQSPLHERFIDSKFKGKHDNSKNPHPVLCSIYVSTTSLLYW